MADAADQSVDMLRGHESRVPATKAVAAGRILAADKERAARLRAALIEKGGGAVVGNEPCTIGRNTA